MSLPPDAHLTLVHPTDYASYGQLAFAHAVALAMRGKYAMQLVHVDTGGLGPRHSGVREVIDVLRSWNALPQDLARPDNIERDLGLSVVGVAIPARDVRASVIDYLEHCKCDLAVIATRQHRGLSRWLERSLADRTLRRASTLALLMRENARGFVDPLNGTIKLRSVLVAAEGRVDLGPALRRLDDFLEILGLPVSVQLLHIGPSSEDLRLPDDGRKRALILRDGQIADTILDTARRVSADLIALPTNRKNGIVAALRGSVTAELLDDGRWPLLSVPAA